MSLLLDALKKAAEQKVENSRETEAERESADETVLDDQTRTEVASENETTRQYDRADSSQFDVTETRIESDETEVHTVVADESIAGSLNEDESLILTDDDVTAFMGDDTLLRREYAAADSLQDDTELETAFTQTSIEPDESKKYTGYSKNEPVEEDISISLFEEDDTLMASKEAKRADALSEETELERVSQNDAESETIYTQPGSESDGPVNEDISISLFNEDDTLTIEQAATQAAALSEKSELDLTPLNDPTKSLNLVEIPEADGTEVEVGISASDPESHTLTREETSTRTFAPDNYDRTLRKPPTSDVSKIFTGVKPDTDIVMTPEYAKTMFRSKSSAQRIHSFKIYVGTALSIFVVIVVLGVLQIDEETINIDNSLRHLKRDPMPGLIKKATDETFTNIFAATPGSEVDATTLQIVENAELTVDTEEVVAVELGVEEESLVENANLDQIDSEVTNRVGVQQSPTAKVEANSVKNIGDNNIRAISISADKSTANNAIQISSKSRITETDRWLREAYAAYLRGDDELALAKYNAVLDVDPNNRNALLARAAINVQNNRIAEAMRDYRTLLIANPKDSLAMTSLIAIANYSPEQSETQLKLMIRDEPDSPYLNFALGNIFGAQNRWQEAQGRYFTALENNPDDPNYAYNLAVSLEHIARPKVAIAYYERALNNYTNGLATFDRDMVDVRLEMLRKL